MAALFLHVGHGKTGSSYLQACFAAAADGLAGHGVAYPLTGGGADPAAITTGNGALLRRALGGKDVRLPGGSLLFSRELFFRELMEPGARERLVAFAAEHGLGPVHVLLFIRDPIEHAASSYQQTVKRSGSTASLTEFLETYRLPELVERFLDTFANTPGVGITVRNYGRVRDRLRQTATAWLGVPAEVLGEPDVPRVNRALTAAELALQLAVNRVAGAAGRVLADRLCEALPDLPARPLLPPLDAQERLLDRLRPVLGRLEGRIEPPHRYLAEPIAPGSHEADPAFGDEQLAVIGGVLGEALARGDDAPGRGRSRRLPG
jgi:hypothetical protein